MNARTLLLIAGFLPIAPALVAAAETDERSIGRNVYQMACAACHTTGVAGAPKLGDGAAWSPRFGQGMSALYAGAIKGKGAMPPKGGNAGLPDADVRAAVDFIVAQVRRSAGVGEPPSEPQRAAPARPAAPAGATRAALTSATAAPAAPDPNAFNRLWTGASTRNPPPAEDGIHDPAGAGASTLQPPALAFERLPRTNAGNFVNWVAALGAKQIQPRWDVRTPGSPMVMDLNIVREVKGTMPDVVFPHKQHTEWLDCGSCHPAIFVPQKGANRMSMASIVLGQGCGTCHGRVAFPISDCRLCHSRAKEAPRTAASGQ